MFIITRQCVELSIWSCKFKVKVIMKGQRSYRHYFIKPLCPLHILNDEFWSYLIETFRITLWTSQNNPIIVNDMGFNGETSAFNKSQFWFTKHLTPKCMCTLVYLNKTCCLSSTSCQIFRSLGQRSRSLLPGDIVLF